MTAGLDRDTPDAVLDALAELAGQYLPPETLLAFDARVGFPEEAVRRMYNPELCEATTCGSADTLGGQEVERRSDP
jgi:hypothetical protein